MLPGGRRDFHTACRPLAPMQAACVGYPRASRTARKTDAVPGCGRNGACFQHGNRKRGRSEEDIILFVFGMIDMYTPKCNKKPKEFMQIVYQVKVD